MKKKLMSLLLVIAIMVSSVSMGFGSIGAFAEGEQVVKGPANSGVEAINAFELTANTVNGTSGTATVKIRSNNSNYKIKVNSINGYYKYMKESEDTSKTVSFSIGSNNVCGNSDTDFSATITVDANLSALIRYECNYDLLDSNGNVVYEGMTGIGYGYISADGDETGKATGSNVGTPGTPGSGYTFNSFQQVNTSYVQASNITLSCQTKTKGHAWGGRGSETRTMTISGTAPSTLSVSNIGWTYVDWAYQEKTKNVDWFVLSGAPSSGFYNFNILYDNSPYANITMYYRNSSDQNSADNIYKTDLDKGLEKSYYTTDSWNKYMAALDKVALVAMAVPNNNYAFQVACQTAPNLSGALTELENARNGLVQVPADYAAAWDAWYTFDGKSDELDKYPGLKNKTVSVTTYIAGAHSYGNNNKDYLYYSQSSIKAVTDYANTINLNLMKCEQKTVDGYEAKIRELTANLTCADAVYTYLDNAINEYSTFDGSIYKPELWSAYTTAVDNANRISKSLKTDSQSGINAALITIFNAKEALEKLDADFTDLNYQIERAKKVVAEYEAGEMITHSEEFDNFWENTFKPNYNAAISDDMQDSKTDEQGKVDDAAYRLSEAVNAAAKFRILDTKELEVALALTPEYSKKYYEKDSYDTWDTLWWEGFDFSQKAAPDYTGTDRKTYENYEEMERLTEVIINAFESLEKIKADFTELNKAVARIPADEILVLYKEEYVKVIREIVQTITYGETFDEQTKVDEITANLNAAIDELTYDHYKPADYSDVEKAIAEARAINPDFVNNYSIVQAAIDAVDWDKKIIEEDQKKVDDMAAAIRDAIKNLDYKLADYSDVDKAIAEAEAVENKHWYANYYKVEEAIAAVDRTKNHLQQDEVNAMATAIREAIKKLKLADADYSGIRDAIALYNAQAPLTDFEPDTVAAVDQAIANVNDYDLKADKQYIVDAWEAEIIKAIDNMKLLPADYSRLNAAKAYAESFNPEEYSNYQSVLDAIAAVKWDLNCRQNAEMNAQIAAINNAVANLKLLPADYTKVEEAIVAAREACVSGDYPYTQESIDAVEAVIENINWDYDIQHQADVDAYILKIQIAVAQLTYIRADYDALDAVKAKYENLQRDLYASLSAVDAYVAKIDWNKTIDKQSEVDTYVEELDAMLENLEYAPADYTAVDNAITIYNSINKEYYEDYDIAVVDALIAQVEEQRGLKKDEQDKVNKMADDINAAVADLRTKMKKADLDALLDAVEQANAKLDEMDATGYSIDYESLLVLDTLLRSAKDYNEETTIDNQKYIDELVANIIEATANLEFVFTIDLKGTDLVIKDGYIYGFEEGTTWAKAKDLIKFVGAAEIMLIESDNGFGTGATIQFKSTKDGSIIGTYTVLVFGDANGDAVIDMFDVAYIVELVNEGDKPEDMLLRALDIRKDGILDAYDVANMIALANMNCTLMQDGSMVMVY